MRTTKLFYLTISIVCGVLFLKKLSAKIGFLETVLLPFAAALVFLIISMIRFTLKKENKNGRE